METGRRDREEKQTVPQQHMVDKNWKRYLHCGGPS